MRGLVGLTIAACTNTHGPPHEDAVTARLRSLGATCERLPWGKVECSEPRSHLSAKLQVRPGGTVERLHVEVGAPASQLAWPTLALAIDGLIGDDARTAIYRHLDTPPAAPMRFENYEVTVHTFGVTVTWSK